MSQYGLLNTSSFSPKTEHFCKSLSPGFSLVSLQKPKKNAVRLLIIYWVGVNTKFFLSWQFHEVGRNFLFTETLLKIKAFELIKLVISVTIYALIEIKWTLSTYEYVIHTFFFAVSFDSFCTISCARVTIFKMYPWKEIFQIKILVYQVLWLFLDYHESHHRDQRLITVFVYADL